MEQHFKIRKIQKEDVNFVYKAICELEKEILDFEVFEKIFKTNILNSDNVYLLAENEMEAMGFISFHTQQVLHHCGIVGEIQEFFIQEKYRGKGVGRQLIQKIVNFSEINNLKSIEVATNKRRVENVLIYESLGFTLTHNKFTIWNSH